MRRLQSRGFRLAAWLATLACVPGGALWALTPLGIQLADQRLPAGSDRFWQLFSAAPILLLIGLAGLWVVGFLGSGKVARLGALTAGFGLALVVAGNIGQFWLNLDGVYPVTAPAYRSFRIGLLVLAVSAVVLGVNAAYQKALPLWAVLPFTVAAVCGLAAFLVEVGGVGAGLWSAFGAGWIWLGFSVVVALLADLRRRRKPSVR